MKFDLVRPCPECPFSTLPGAVRLGRARVIEILQAVTLQGASFPVIRRSIMTRTMTKKAKAGPRPIRNTVRAH